MQTTTVDGSAQLRGPVWLLAVLATVWAYYWYEWRSFQAFVTGIDHSPQFMQDFVGHYYPMGQQLFQTATPAGGFFYSSFFALLMVPLGRLPLPSAMAAWATVQVACTVALFVLSARGFLGFSGIRSRLFFVLFATSYPILNNFKWGQVSVLLTLSVVGAVVAERRGHRVLGGVLLAFGTAIKFYPMLFLVYFAVKRDLRACASFLAALAVFYVLVPASFLGFRSWFAFEQALADLLSRPGLAARDPNSQYIGRVLMRWLTPIVAQDWRLVVQQSLVYVGYAIGAAAIVAAVLSLRRRSQDGNGLPVVALFLAIPFLVKTSWPHYFSYLPMCQAAVLAYYWERGGAVRPWRRGNLALCVLSMALSSLLVFNRFPGWETYNSAGMLFLANLLLLVPVFAALARRPVLSTDDDSFDLNGRLTR